MSEQTPKRIGLLGLHLESNAFAPVTTEEHFRTLCVMEGRDIIADSRLDNPKGPAEIPAFIAEMDRLGVNWQPVPAVVAAAEPGGPCEQGFLDRTLGRMRQMLADAGPLDGVYISAHGGMTATGSDDPDGDLFAMVRGVIGEGVPLIATLDLHANISERMVADTDVLISYRTNPHVDQQDRAREAAAVMVEMLNGMKTAKAFVRTPIVAPTVTLLTAEGPYADLIDYGQQAKARAKSGAIVNVSVVAGFAFSDLAKNGLAVIVTARGDKAPARALAHDIAGRAWAMRERFQRRLMALADAVDLAVANGEDGSRPALIFADVADNPGGGGTGTTTWILDALYGAGARGVLMGIFHQPALAGAAHAAGEGAEIDAVFNEDGESEFAKRFQAPARVETITDGRIVGRRGIWAGRSLDLGPSALLDLDGRIRVAVVSNRKQCADPALFEMFGLDIADARTVVVKSRGHFRAGFDEFFPSDRTHEIDAPGLTSPVLGRFSFKNLPRPVYPLDPDTEWAGPA